MDLFKRPSMSKAMINHRILQMSDPTKERNWCKVCNRTMNPVYNAVGEHSYRCPNCKTLRKAFV